MGQPASIVPAARRRLLGRRIRRDESGATAIEFGLVALPFFALMFAILETALLFLASQTLETASRTTTRRR
jgi:Flp pilus assembly protein TadG